MSKTATESRWGATILLAAVVGTAPQAAASSQISRSHGAAATESQEEARTPPASIDEIAHQVMAFEREVEEAILRADVEFLDRVCASDFTYTHGDGWTTGGEVRAVDRKSEWLESLPGRYSQREVDSQQVEIHGDVAITMGRIFARSGGEAATQRSFSFWYVRVYAYRSGQWTYLSHRTVHGPVYEELVADDPGQD